VVLSACDAARASLAGGASLGLAQAFALAGATAVVAPARPVRDDTALALVTTFYRELSTSPSFDPARALQAAQAEVRRTAPQSDWASFRVIVP
jgi:CHAT domain-containing protein